MLSPDTIGTDLIHRGQEVIIHLSCKDWNRNALQSRAWKLSSEGFHNVLALSGDYPITGYEGAAAPVFDTDSVGLLRMLEDMNEGTIGTRRGGEPPKRTRFFLGAVVTNHKRHEREVMPQYFKLRKKIENGARFVINQIGYHARKDDELLRWMRLHGLSRPRHRQCLRPLAGRRPRLQLRPDPRRRRHRRALALVEHHAASRRQGQRCSSSISRHARSPSPGASASAAPTSAATSQRPTMTISWIAPTAWHRTTGGRSPARSASPTPTNSTTSRRTRTRASPSDVVSAAYLESRRKRTPTCACRCAIASAGALHAAAFEQDAPLQRRRSQPLRRRRARAAPIGKALHVVERAGKASMFGCRDCGDCSLPDIAYLCPESQCAKNQRNGPCGGTRDGACEVGEKQCIWALAYERLKKYGEEETMLEGPVVIKDNALRGTSAWANAFLGRDHVAKKHESSSSLRRARSDSRRGNAAVPHHRREHPHDPDRPPAGAARRSPTTRGGESILFVDEHGEERTLPIPEEERRTQDYEEGRVKHVRSAVRLAKDGAARTPRPASPTCARWPSGRSSAAPTSSTSTSTRSRTGSPSRSRRWCGSSRTIAPIVPVPLSIDSSNLEIIAAGIEAARELAEPADAQLGLARAHRGARPRGRDRWGRDRDRGRGVRHALEHRGAGRECEPHDRRSRWRRASPPDLLYVDPLVFPISVDGDFGEHCLGAFRELRARYGAGDPPDRRHEQRQLRPPRDGG